MTRLYAGSRLRHLREDRGLSQAELARRLELSPSYLNQLERDRRPITAAVLLRLVDTLGVDPRVFGSDQESRLEADLRDVLAGHPVSGAEIAELVRRMPRLAQALVDRQAAGPPQPPHEAVRDYFHAHRNYVGPLDEAAEATAEACGVTPGDARTSLATRLRERHRVRFASLHDIGRDGETRRFDPAARILYLSPQLRPGQQAFQLATELALLEHGDLLDDLVADAAFDDPTVAGLARIGLARHYAAALVMPYRVFHGAAEGLRYDIERLSDRFDVSFEATCHRLSTLQRPGLEGVPFSFVRVDRAGNISKRQSATGFHFSRSGGSCPLWNVYEAFSSPGQILTQVAQMPDGRAYLWVARTVTRRRGGYGLPAKRFALGLGCEVRHARRVVYSTGLDLADLRGATPIGAGCRVCERLHCPQRAFPPLGHDLRVDAHRDTFVPYTVAD